MFRVKICGITCADDALLAADAGADAIGLNFYSGSSRYLTRENARKIVAALPIGISKVGVFVNSPLADILAIFKETGLNAIQLHGDESPAFVASLRVSLPQRVNIVRAFRCREASLLSVSDYLAECLALGPLPDAALLDAFKPGQYGGTGEVADWNAIRRDRALLGSLPIILAGGLTAENVGEAIAAARPDGVDTASGVESSAGRKDPQRVRQFVSAANAALALTLPSPPNPVPW